ncbi:PAS domain-containing sensor histidine kinase [Chitinophaga alhagiae]|uniref:histidine kinase n=1 Tax=Chitinophaga alhagiae TaxID=2203219 RepID=A0ABN5LX52_9BACT|nr:ATP-binding protein [Chitinophaga alhagiae]AWO01391.1 PAS domain-containing sensor histidine kinase [Chitinophaga alhagiae]
MTRLKLKTKITLGVLFLFCMLLLVSILGYYYIGRVNREAGAILQDNYESVEYAKNMLMALEARPVDSLSFVKNQALQERNVTEAGEAAATAQLRRHFQEKPDLPALRQDLYTIMELNMKAIVMKNERTKATADKALLYIAIISGICFLLGISFVYNFPGYIANPIRELTEGIKGIARRRYEQRLYFRSGDEFGELAEAFNTMAQQLHAYEHSNLARILFEKKRAEAVIGSLKDATIGIDNKGNVLFANGQALQLLNMQAAEVAGRPAGEIAQRNDLMQYLLGKTDNGHIKIVVNGRESFFTKETADIHYEQEKIGYIIILKNITTYREIDLAKTQFIATISHELKTPLAATDLSLTLLDDERSGPLSPEQQELVDSLRQDNRRMIRMVSELLDFSREQSGNIQLQIQAVEPADIVQYALGTVSKEAAGRNLAIQARVPDSLPRAAADAEKSAWVLVNLLTNAIRYSPAGAAVELAVEVTATNTLLFSVQDAGPGIDPAFRGKIFERFFQVPGAENSKGSGLGLAIAREFIEAQGGTIGVSSAPGKGSRFWFELPAA